MLLWFVTQVPFCFEAACGEQRTLPLPTRLQKLEPLSSISNCVLGLSVVILTDCLLIVYRNMWTFVMRSCSVTTYWLSRWCWGEDNMNVVKLLKQFRVGWDESEGLWVGNEINFAVFLIFVTGGVSFLITKCQGQPQSSLSIHHWYW